MIQFTSVNSGGGLHIRLVERIKFPQDSWEDPDYELAAASVAAHYLDASVSVSCTAMRLFTNNEPVPEDGIFRAVEMTFNDTCTMFFDPFWIDGIRLGAGNTPDLWLAEHRAPRLQDAFGPRQETTWRPASR